MVRWLKKSSKETMTRVSIWSHHPSRMEYLYLQEYKVDFMVVQGTSFVVMFVPLISWPSVIWLITGMTKVLNILFNLYKNNITSKSGLRQSYRENNSEENGAKDAWIFSNPVFNLFQAVPTHLNFHLNFHFHFLLTFHIKMKIIFVFFSNLICFDI